ncbi:hypothetical protein ACFL6I_16730 [candidate division KSB1 bacterium]
MNSRPSMILPLSGMGVQVWECEDAGIIPDEKLLLFSKTTLDGRRKRLLHA